MAAFAGNLSGSPDQSSTTHKQKVAQQSPANPSPVTVTIENTQRSEPEQTARPESPKGYASPEGALVFVGIATCLVIMWQAWETRKSAQAMQASIPLQQQAAEATNLIAISTLRPKLVIRGLSLVPGTLVRGVGEPDVWQIECLVANTGGSEAHVTESNLTITRIEGARDRLPVFPPYDDKRDWLGGRIIRPGEHTLIRAII